MEERNLSPEMQEMLSLHNARMQSYKQLADVEAANMALLVKRGCGVDLVNEKWELDLERGVLKRVSKPE